MTDDELLRRLGTGDRAAFEAILERFERPLLRFANGLLGDPERAQDAVQETFLRLLSAGEELARVRSLPAWLFQVTRNQCYDQRKKERRMSEREAAHTIEAARGPEAPDAPALAEEVRRLVEGALDDLPARQRQALLLKTWEGLSYREIGERLGLSEANVAYHVRQALRAVARRLRKSGVSE